MLHDIRLEPMPEPNEIPVTPISVDQGAWLARFDMSRSIDAAFVLRHSQSPLLVAGALCALVEEFERLLPIAVAEARADGVSWAVIAQALKVSRQAASQRFGEHS